MLFRSFVLFAEDHPVTGEVYPFVEELDKLLNEKRIFSFRISHARHFHEAVEIRPYTVRFCSYAQDVAVALLGERFRSPSISAQNMNWNKEEFLARITEARSAHATNQLLIEKFEAEISAVAKPYFTVGSARLFDRAAVVFHDFSAESLAESVFKKVGLSAEEGWRKQIGRAHV